MTLVGELVPLITKASMFVANLQRQDGGEIADGWERYSKAWSEHPGMMAFDHIVGIAFLTWFFTGIHAANNPNKKE